MIITYLNYVFFHDTIIVETIENLRIKFNIN